jgi:hypothetical protein
VTEANDRAYDRLYDMEMYIGEYCSYFSKTNSRFLSTTRLMLYVAPVLSNVELDRSGKLDRSRKLDARLTR